MSGRKKSFTIPWNMREEEPSLEESKEDYFTCWGRKKNPSRWGSTLSFREEEGSQRKGKVFLVYSKHRGGKKSILFFSGGGEGENLRGREDRSSLTSVEGPVGGKGKGVSPGRVQPHAEKKAP